MNYWQYNERQTRKPPARTEHGTEIVDIPDVMVTEWVVSDSRHDWAACPCVMCRIDRGEDE